MKLPQTIVKFCPYCRKHTEHRVIIVKPSKKRGGLSWGGRKAKEGKKGRGNHGKYSKRPISQRKRGLFKTSKGVDVRLECVECKKQVVWVIHGRYKKVEISSGVKK